MVDQWRRIEPPASPVDSSTASVAGAGRDGARRESWLRSTPRVCSAASPRRSASREAAPAARRSSAASVPDPARFLTRFSPSRDTVLFPRTTSSWSPTAKRSAPARSAPARPLSRAGADQVKSLLRWASVRVRPRLRARGERRHRPTPTACRSRSRAFPGPASPSVGRFPSARWPGSRPHPRGRTTGVGRCTTHSLTRPPHVDNGVPVSGVDQSSPPRGTGCVEGPAS